MARRAAHGFTLIEVLLVVGLIAIVSSLFILNANSILSGLGSKPLPDQLRLAIREARYQAGYTKGLVELSYDNAKADFVLRRADGSEITRIKSGADPDNAKVQFLHVLPEKGLGGRGRGTEEAQVDHVRFHPDRSSTPFAVELEVDRTRSKHRFDAFSDIELEEKR